MLSKRDQEIAECRRRAAECGETAAAAVNQQTKQIFQHLEQRWLSFAESLEFAPGNGDKG